MTEKTTPLSATNDEFALARGEDSDTLWANAASWRLLMRHVESAVVLESLREALDLVRQTQQDPRDLYGDPRAYADELCAQWLADGRRVHDQGALMPWREVPSDGMAASALMAVVMTGVLLAQGELTMSSAVAGLLLPPVLGFGSTAGLAMWEAESRRWPMPAAVASMALLGVVVAAVGAALFAVPSFAAPTWVLLPTAVAFGVLSHVLRRSLYAVPTPLQGPAADEDEWRQRLTGILRGSLSLPEVRVRAILADAHAHTAESGLPLAEEFGSAEDYAARFSPDVGRKARLTGVGLTVLALVSALPLLEGFSWTATALTILLGSAAIGGARKARAARRDRGIPGSPGDVGIPRSSG